MRKIIICLLVFLLASCSLKQMSAHSGDTLTSSIGSPLISWQTGSTLGGTRYELTYAGIENNTININYAEFAFGGKYGGWLARSAFAQALKYDLSKSKIITFRDVKLQVEAADNSQIIAKVIQEPRIE